MATPAKKAAAPKPMPKPKKGAAKKVAAGKKVNPFAKGQGK